MFASFSFNVAADSELCTTEMVASNGEAAGTRTPARNRAMLKRVHCPILELTVEKYFVPHPGP